MASKFEYGPNPHAGRNPNADNGWGGYQWPGGVPTALLALVTAPGGVKIVIRRELAELVALNYQIADRKYGRVFTRGWTGGYSNRPIGGTKTASNHSKGKAIDNDAQDNPMTTALISNLPPGLVADWESTGWYWGGRYTGKTDTMHFEYCYSPADVPGHVARAKQILGALTVLVKNEPTPAPAPAPVAVPAGPPGFPGLLQRGSKGDGVRQLQTRLNAHLVGSGKARIGVDGDFGPGTYGAVVWFQTVSGRGLTVDGMVGPRTWTELFK